ncbi:FAD-dependent oxidoreductase [Pusillimonas sp. MFBS29]|uniref:NAD(P)/FAD-dependent oxidoreductase n=1 Tax=Pusillimonas sp. MFBS29 TaxID=2886690 RepID=UPI001D1021BD|nr:FAD-dependent oxidoreductase [Pusillimonas sp. MFBS29]MCC2597215.1 FAD-dependent oxidoreductase [Pusillimonas sp. MFBS29]
MTTNRVVIVGAGQAGGWAARTLRDEGYQGSIVLVGAETHAPYERPPLSKEILLGQSEPEALTIVDHATLESLNVETRLGAEAVAIERTTQQVVLTGGEHLPYDKLILCTGGRARQLPIPGMDDERVHTLRSLDDALRLKQALTTRPGHVLVIGGGWIGLEVAASARQLGCPVTIVEFADRVCQRSITADVSEVLHDLHTSQQSRILLGTQVLAINAAEQGLSAELSNGQTLQCDHVIMAAGLLANDELARQAGLICNNHGIQVDGQCRTNDPAIYAAGDVAVMETAGAPGLSRLESWQNAQDQGMAVARSILGQEVEYRPTPMLWSQQFDQFIQIAGHVHGGAITAMRTMPNGGTLRFYLTADEVVAGVIGMNAGRDYRFAKQLVERGLRAGAADLADPGIPLKQLAATNLVA